MAVRRLLSHLAVGLGDKKWDQARSVEWG